MDAADLTSFTFSSGSNISLWKDKSGNSNNFTTINGTNTRIADGAYSVVSFPSGAVMSSANQVNLTTTSALFIISKLTSTAGRYLLAFTNIDDGFGDPAGDFSIRLYQGILQGVVTTPLYGNAGDIGNGNYYVNGTFNPSLTSTTFLNTYSLIGTVSSLRSGSTYITFSTTIYSPNVFYIGNIAEFIFYPNGVSKPDRQQIEGYLAWKWGLQGSLDSSNPYKNSSPSTTNPLGISRPANLPIPSIVCTPIRTYFLVTGGLVFHVDAGNPASYPGSGSTWYDLSTSGLNVTLYSSPTYSSANGGYIAFTPSSSQYGETTVSYNTVLTRWTTEAWHYFTNVTAGNLSAIICKTYGGDVNFALGSPVGGASGKNLAAAYYSGGWYYTSSTYTLPSVGWYHIVGTYDGTNLNLYVNNVLTQTQASSQTPGLGGGLIHLMRRWDTGDYWGGYLAIARVYNRALSADEINTNYQLSKARFGLS
jgi:hypothetical protein